MRGADTGVPRVAVTLAAAAALLTRINPLTIFSAAAVLGVPGLLRAVRASGPSAGADLIPSAPKEGP